MNTQKQHTLNEDIIKVSKPVRVLPTPCNNDPITTSRDRARQKFIDAGLTYNILNPSTLQDLIDCVNPYLDMLNTEDGENSCHLYADGWTFFKDDNKVIIGAEVYLNADYFKKRECVTFNVDGFIGMAGECDKRRTEAIVHGFNDWVVRNKFRMEEE